MTNPKPINIDRLRELHEESPKGLWHWLHTDTPGARVTLALCSDPPGVGTTMSTDTKELIVETHNALPALLDAAEQRDKLLVLLKDCEWLAVPGNSVCRWCRVKMSDDCGRHRSGCKWVEAVG